MMEPEFLDEVEALMVEAAGCDPAVRSAMLEAHCRNRPEVRAEVESLLAALEGAGGFLDSPPVCASRTPDPHDDDGPGVGDRVGAYHLVEAIGEGGMGKVYRAERVDGEFRHEVAIKVIAAPNASGVRRFRLERQILATLRHPNVVTLLDGGTLSSGHTYLVMEYVRGAMITTYCRDRCLSVEDRLRLFCRVCMAVHHAHGRHIVHRDLKASNVLIAEDGTPKVLDFGVAKLLEPDSHPSFTLTLAGPAPLTPDYASPEQLRGLPVTPAADIYALGVLLYEILSGSRPYETAAKPLDEVLDIVVRGTIVPPSAARPAAGLAPPYATRCLRGDLDAVVLMALEKAPENRYESARALADDLESYLEGRPASARVRRSGVVAWIVRAAILVACALLSITTGPASIDATGGEAPASAGSRSPARWERPGGTTNKEAWALYQRGLQIWRTRTDLAATFTAYRRALALDPQFALAHVALADAYAIQSSPSPEAERAVGEALRLVPALGEAHATMGFIRLFHYWDWQGAEDALRQATTLAPDYAQGHHWLGCLLMLMRRFDEARHSLERAAGLDRKSPPILVDLGLLAYYTGDDERAVRYCDEANGLQQDFGLDCLVRAYERLGRFDEAWRIRKRVDPSIQPPGKPGPALLQQATRLWVERIVRYVRDRPQDAVTIDRNIAYNVALGYARLGNERGALEWLVTAQSWHAFKMPFVNVEPEFDEMRRFARFQEILKTMGLGPRFADR